MKYAICLRGISYYKDYTHDNREGMTPYTIDFMDCIPYLFKNVILPLREDGHQVDIFFLTYNNEKLGSYVDILKPKRVGLRNFNPNITSGAWNNIINLMIGSIDIVERYANEKNITYDYTIISRFDLLQFENIKNTYIIPDGVSVVTKGNDCFFVIGKDLNKKVMSGLELLMKSNRISHEYTMLLTTLGIRCHTMYPHIDNDKYPFYRIARHHFNNEGHHYYHCDLYEIFNENCKYYGFFHKPNMVYTPCY
jgi:hypothetical protein